MELILVQALVAWPELLRRWDIALGQVAVYWNLLGSFCLEPAFNYPDYQF